MSLQGKRYPYELGCCFTFCVMFLEFYGIVLNVALSIIDYMVTCNYNLTFANHIGLVVFFVVVNIVPKSWFSGQRGVCQRDPLSSFLFSLVAGL